MAAHAKFYFFDCGVFRDVRPSGPIDSETELGGPLLEGLVLQHLRGLKTFPEDYPESRVIFWCRGKETIEQEGVLCMPVEDFLMALHPFRKFPI